MSELQVVLNMLNVDSFAGILTDMKTVIAASVAILLVTYGCFIIMRVMGVKVNEDALKEREEDDDV